MSSAITASLFDELLIMNLYFFIDFLYNLNANAVLCIVLFLNNEKCLAAV
jgi:hypothetical protein